jgi:hypothetical protein
MYMTATGLGPMQAIFLIGSYYYLKNVYKKNICNRCGRTGHSVNDCYARTDIDGDKIDSEEEESD